MNLQWFLPSASSNHISNPEELEARNDRSKELNGTPRKERIKGGNSKKSLFPTFSIYRSRFLKVNLRFFFALVFPTKQSTLLSFSFGRLSPTLGLQWWELCTPALQWTRVLRLTIFRIVVDLSGVTFVTYFKMLYPVRFYLSKSTTLYVVYVWKAYLTGDRRRR